ncbi:MAG: metalloprotease TldD, partial [Endozoicomonadaceae bacterium]|nr:metalloprotease TldD [Endozoicomonadaceae bacterium]
KNIGKKQDFKRVFGHSLYHPNNPLSSLSPGEKVAFLRKIDEYTRAQDTRVQRVKISLSCQHDTILIYDSDGTIAADRRPLICLNISLILSDKGRVEQGFYGGGARCDYDYFMHDNLWENYAKEAVRIAQVNFESIAAPAGLMPVVLGAGWNGVLLHEAVGHGLEGDFNRKGTSAYAGRLQETVASSLCTIVDDGTIENRRGSLNVDDEGIPAKKNILIEKGVLKQYMQDKMNARLMGVAPTGNGRRQSYAHIPMPRMTNTYMLPGQDVPDDIISSVSKGIYIVNMGGGQVDITSGQFVFAASEAYLIEKGKVTQPIKGATLIGNGPDIMNKVSMVGHDLALDPGIGVCGKAGQTVPVGVGQPTLKIDEMTVGGTNT